MEGKEVYEKKKTADWEAEEADLLETALELIATGAVPEEEEEEEQKATATKKRVPGRIVEGTVCFDISPRM